MIRNADDIDSLCNSYRVLWDIYGIIHVYKNSMNSRS